MFILNPQLGKPLYRQLVEQVRRMISRGNLKPGEALPSVRALAEEHAINPMTISKAYALLESEGLLERNPGKPMTVASFRRSREPTRDPGSIESSVRELVSRARDREIERHELVALLEKLWEET